MKKNLAILICLALALCCAAQAEESFGFSDGMEMHYVSSFEEAAPYYEGEIPAFTAPEGFYLMEILVNDFGLTAYYSTVAPRAEGDAAEGEARDAENAQDAALAQPEAISRFEFSIYDYGKSADVSYYSMREGVLSEAEASMVALHEAAGVVYSADVYTVKGAVYFYFEGLDATQVEAVLTGLQV